MTKTGTVQFSAPEIFLQSIYDSKVDVWSAGVVLFMMLSGMQPFFSDNLSCLIKTITTEEPSYELEAFKQVSNEALDLLQKMLTKDPNKRPSAKECLSHNWFSNLDSNEPSPNQGFAFKLNL